MFSYPAAGAGLTGTKMARRIGDLEEFEFKAIGENHNQGVSAYFQLATRSLCAFWEYQKLVVSPLPPLFDN